MRKLVVLFIIVVTTPFVIIGILVFKGCNFEFPLKEIYLNTNKMKEADIGTIDHSYNSSLIKVYTFDKKESIKDSIHPADVFIYAFFKDSLSKTADTVILLDSHLHGSFEPKRISDFLFEIKEAKKLNGCKLLIPKYQILLFKNYKYKYANVHMLLEDID